MSRRAPVATIGRVRVLEPTGTSPYYRFSWTRADGSQGRTSACRTLPAALERAAAIELAETRANKPKSLVTLGEIAAEYLSSPTGRNQRTQGDWRPTQMAQVRQKMTRMLRGFAGRQAAEYDRALADQMRAQAGTRTTVRENTRVLRAFVRWGATQGYFSPEQAELLPPACLEVAPALAGTPAPRRRDGVRRVGTAAQYVRDEDAPSRAQVISLGEQMEARFPGWGHLAVELATDSGPRFGEQLQLTAHDVRLEPIPCVAIDWQLNDRATRANGQPRRIRPKGDKTRSTGLAETSWTGFPLLDAIRERQRQALVEQAEGRNPEALLFPTQHGRLWWHTTFSKAFRLAAADAGWPMQQWVETTTRWDPATDRPVVVTRPRNQLVLTWHSLRHRFARICIDVRGFTPGELMAAGGWENLSTVETRYYRSGKEHEASALAKFQELGRR